MSLFTVWGEHPNYFYIDNQGRDWQAKSREAQQILSAIMAR
jgi:hypothetical protein